MTKFFNSTARILGVAVTAFTMMAAVADAAETWRFAHKQPADSPEGKVHQFFADRVGELSKGELTVQVFPSEQLGKEDAILEQLELGTVNLYAEDAFFLQKWVPDIKWIAPIFLFPSRESWLEYTNSDLAKSWFAQVEETAGIRPLGDPMAVVRGPYRVLLSKTPMQSYKDFAGAKLRMYPDQLAIEVWTHLGADLAMLAWTETYQGLQSGLANAVTSPAALVQPTGFYEQAPYVVRTNEFWQGLPYMMNAEEFEALSEELQQVLIQAHAEAGAFSSELMLAGAQAQQAALTEKGVTFIEMPMDELFADMREWYAKKQANGELPAGMMDAVTAALAK